MNSGLEVENNLRKRLLLPTLLLSEFAIFSFSVFLSVLLLDVATSFKVPLGTASQLGTASRLIGIFAGLAASALALKLKTKTMLLSGIVTYFIGILGSFWAPNFTMMLVFSVVVGAGVVLTGTMILVVIGEELQLKRRGWAIGLVTAAAWVSNILVPYVSTFLNVLSGWRAVLLWFLLPTTIVSVILCLLIVPSRSVKAAAESKPEYKKVYGKILINRSPAACVFAAGFFNFGLSLQLYLTSFYRITFAVTPAMAAVFYSTVSVLAFSGALACGRLINRIGRKLLTYIPIFLCGLTTIFMVFSPNLWLSVGFWFINATTAAMAAVALNNLTVEQVPEFRGSMMSVQHMFRYTGLFLGPLVGGLVLNYAKNDFVLIFTIFAVAMIFAVPLIAFLSKDPCKVTAPP